MTDIEKVKSLYSAVCSQKMTDGESGARCVSEIENIIGKKFRNTQEFHYHVADFLKRKQIINATPGTRMVRLRKKQGLTQNELATKLSVDRRTIARWERDEQLPSQDALKWLDEQNGASPDNVTFGEGVG
jgi:DNA-binding transcriptional regulator YiaG